MLGLKVTLCLGLLLSELSLFLFFSNLSILALLMGYILIVLAVQGIGIGFTMSPENNAVKSSVLRNCLGIGSALNDTTRQLGGSLGVAVLGA
jgi:hypothetical protein